MKRDWDLIREFLLKLEEKGPSDHSLRANALGNDCRAELAHQMEILLDAGLVAGQMSKSIGGPPDFIATRLTWHGHEFLDAVRSDTIWEKTKTHFVSKGLSLTFDLARSVAIGFTKQALGLDGYPHDI